MGLIEAAAARRQVRQAKRAKIFVSMGLAAYYEEQDHLRACRIAKREGKPMPDRAAKPKVYTVEDAQRVQWLLANVRDKTRWSKADHDALKGTHELRKKLKLPKGYRPADAADYSIN